VTEAESILDIASATYRPSRMLRWHYRSRHGSLIAFSNKEFYRGRLVVFPSPAPISATLGVKLVHVRDGIYQNSQNVTEARRVGDTVIAFLERQPRESLGVVAMNASQRELIEDLLESASKRSDLAHRYIAERARSLEPFFVKNLENVQGDERDVIYISTTYGRSPSGQVFQRFGPINGLTGHRRLNVLFTRARHRVVLFSSMLAEDILTQQSSSWGVRALKGYLHYAQTGILETASFSGRAPDSDFEIEVANAIRERGYDVVAQVGVAGYFIDLAVRPPHKSDAFLLGIECDGKSYHSGLSARDRDRLRQQVLEGLGWHIHRIWSTDWFKQPRIEADRLVAYVEQLLRAEQADETAFSQIDPADFEATGEPSKQLETSPSYDPSWDGELAIQPMSVEDAHQALLSLAADAEREFPDVPPEASALRPEMIQALLKFKPASKDAWLRSIPFDLRVVTDGGQLTALLPRIFAITRRML
jgi:very-short-patch-repair endonuclease